MATYEVYYHPVRKFSTIKRGFIWPAFWFGSFWLMYRRCWVSAALSSFGILILNILISATLAHAMAPPAGGGTNAGTRMFFFGIWEVLLGLLPFLAIGIWGSSIVRRNLKARGFVLVGKYSCKTGDAALALLHKEKKKN